MSLRAHKSVGYFLAAGLVSLAVPSIGMAASAARLSGEISGLVTDGAGVPQMGATVLLFNRQDRLFEKALTNERGAFSFASLLPDIYSVRVTLANFVPAIKNNIRVQPGMRSVLNINLAGLFSSIQLVYPVGDRRALMSDDWKWVLRSASSTRPVLRLLPRFDPTEPPESRRQALFSETRGLVKVSAGDAGQALAFGSQPDLGTAFALATSLYGNNQLQFSGNLGYGSQSGIPTAAFRTSYSRSVGMGTPEVSVTMRQLFIPGRVSSGLTGEGSLPALRTMSVSFDDKAQLSDALSFQYGFSLDSVQFLDRLNYFSPYARLLYSLGNQGEVDFAYTSGNARPDLNAGVSGPDAELQHDLATLALFPRVSLRGGRAKVQRGEDFELGYSRTLGSRKFRISGYREVVKNAALTMAAPEGFYNSSDILPDLFSGSSIFNAGDYQTLGYTASVTQTVNDNLSATLMYGSAGVLTAERGSIDTQSPDELRSMIRAGRRHAVTMRVSAVSRWTGTHLIASYQWTDNHRAITPGHLYSTQSVRPVPGLNLYVRQPIPSFSILPWRMEATADLRNLLAESYLPLSLADGRRMLLVQMPRSFRGGLSFIF